jgi:chromosome partitioning protein
VRPKRARRIAVINQKGGTGKTTTAINLAAGVAERGHEVLLIDGDAQGNIGASLGIRGDRTLYHVIVDGADPLDCAIPVRGHLDCVTSDRSLAAAEVWLARRDDAGRGTVLQKRMAHLDRRYQYIIMDCGPSLNLLNQNALMFADEVLIPVACDYLALVGVKQVLATLKEVSRNMGHGVRVTAVVPTFYDARVKLAKDVMETLQSHFGNTLLDPVRRSTRLAEAPVHKQTIFEYAPASQSADDYRRIVDQFVDLAGAASAAGHPQVNA